MLFKIYDNQTNLPYEMELDELVARMTAFNSGGSTEPELLKAFAVMARTELARKTFIYGGKGCESGNGCDICTEPGHCLECGLPEVAVETAVEAAVYDAVKATHKKIILFDGRPIKPYFHYRCGGATENAENITGNRITYLRRVLCTFCKDKEDIDNEKLFTVPELEAFLKTRFKKPDGVYYNIQGMFEDIDVDEQGKVNMVKIGSRTYKGVEIMELLKLSSTRFNYIPVKFLIKCIGTGHGLGLCQCGAAEMARRGSSFDNILKYYYTGVKIEEMQLPDAEKPLKGVRLVLDAAFGGEHCDDNRGANGLREKDANLDIVLRLKDLLAQDGAEVHLTRDRDTEVTMADRAALSNSTRPEFFISVGQNSFMNASASGTELYYYRGDTAGEKLARLMLESVCASLGSKNRGARTADFYLLREVKASSIILLLLYISNPQDEEMLSGEAFRQRAAEAVYHAICTYYRSRAGKTTN